MRADACDCPVNLVRVDADGRCFSCSGDLDHVRETIRRHRLAKGDKPATADADADQLTAKLFDQEVPQ